MHELATIPFERSAATDWTAAGHASIRFSPRALTGAALVKAGRRIDLATQISSAEGIRLPAPTTWAANGSTLWLWQGPREWLLIDNTISGAELAERTRRSIDDVTAVALDVTDRVMLLDISGSAADLLLAKGTSLARALLPMGACCRTRFANLQATVFRENASSDFSLITERATGVYLHKWLSRAARDLAV